MAKKWSFFRRLFQKPREFTEEDMKKSLEVRRKRHDLRIKAMSMEDAKLDAKIARFNAEKEYYLGEEEEETDPATEAFMSIISKAFGNTTNTTPEVSTSFPKIEKPSLPPSTNAALSDSEAMSILSTIPPKYLELAKKMTDEQILSFVSARMPDLPEESKRVLLANFRRLQ